MTLNGVTKTKDDIAATGDSIGGGIYTFGDGSDSSNNTTTARASVTIVDNDDPVLTTGESEITLELGEVYTTKCNSMDNSGKLWM